MRLIRRVGRRLREASQRHFVWLISAVALGFVAAVVLVSDYILRDQISSHSRANAVDSAELLAASGYEPAIAQMMRRGARTARPELTAATRAAVRSGAILDATIWRRDGLIMYSSRAGLTGRRFRLPPDVSSALAGREHVAHTRTRQSPDDPSDNRLDVTIPMSMHGGAPAAAVDLEVPYANVARDIDARAHRLDRVVAAAGAMLFALLIPLLVYAGRLVRRHVVPGQARLVGELERAIGAGELLLEFQPLVDLRTGAVRSVEALVRWDHPRRGRIPPDQFIPLAETSPFFWDFTLHVLDLALAQAASFRRAGLDLSVAVNVSSGNLLDPRLPTELRRLIARHELPAAALELEVTESAIMEESERAAAILGDIAAVGIARIAIDDFGTGHSSLARVRALPIDALKIDRSFVRALESSGDSALVRSVIALGRNLGLLVIAEGIETPSTAARLAQLGCDLGQGYWFARPLPAEELVSWLGWRSPESAMLGRDSSDRRDGPGRRRDDFFSVAFKTAPEAMMIADDAGRWVDANVAACELLGVTREEVRFRRWGGFSPGRSAAELRSTWEALMREGSVATRWEVRGAAGGSMQVELEGTANFLPGLHLFVIRRQPAMV